MNVAETTVDYGLLSELAYLRLESDWFKGTTNNIPRSNKNIEDIQQFLTANNAITT
jgi:hypothetical protein